MPGKSLPCLSLENAKLDENLLKNQVCGNHCNFRVCVLSYLNRIVCFFFIYQVSAFAALLSLIEFTVPFPCRDLPYANEWPFSFSD